VFGARGGFCSSRPVDQQRAASSSPGGGVGVIVRHEVVAVIVWYESMAFVRQTCGSVRSRLSALARLVTVGSEAAETQSRHSGNEEILCEEISATGSVNAGRRDGLSDKPNVSEPLQVPSIPIEPKALTGSRQKVMQSAASTRTEAHGQSRLSVQMAGANPLVSLQLNMVNPMSRLDLGVGAGGSVRSADGAVGRGCRRKRKPLGNRVDRGGRIASPRKRADFRRVVNDEIADRTFTGGNRK